MWIVLQRDFIQLTKLDKASFPMGGVRCMVTPLPVPHQGQDLVGVKLSRGQDPEQQLLHLGQGQARHFFVI